MGTFVITLPDVGEGVAEAELTAWNVAVGDVISEDDVLGEVMTDKAAVEIPSTVSGRVTWLCGQPGDTIPIGARFVELEVEGAGNAPSDSPPQAVEPEQPGPVAAPTAPPVPTATPAQSSERPGNFAMLLPDVGEGVAEAELSEWNVKLGDVVAEDDVLGVVMTDKAAVEIPATASGTVVWLAGEPGASLAIGSEFVRLDVQDGTTAPNPAPTPAAPAEAEPAKAPLASPSQAPTPAPKTAKAAPKGDKPLASPAVRQRARDAGIDLTDVAGTGPAGRISQDDLTAHIADPPAPGSGAGHGQRASGSTEIPVIGMRRKIGEKMSMSKRRIPHFTIVEEVDVTELETLRAQLNKMHADTRGKLTVLPFIVRALVEAMRDHPEVNATFDDEAGVITQSRPVHVGIATQTPGGLMVPVVSHAEARNLWDCAQEVARLSSAARDRTAQMTDLTGSTITITSLGPLGAIATTPIVNHPEVAIIGINKIMTRPVWDEDQVVPRKIMNLSCSFDHRVIDGWNAALFVRKLKDLLETPALLFVEG